MADGVAAPLATQSPVSRRRETLMAVGAGLIGAVAAGGLLVLLVPGSTDTPVLVMPSATAAAQVEAVSSVGEPGRQATITTPTTSPPTTTTPAPTTTQAPFPDSTTVTTVAPDLAEPPPPTDVDGQLLLPSLAHSGATAVPFLDGEFLLTTAQGMRDGPAAVQVTWGDAPRLLATVVAQGDGFTVLQLDRQVSSVAGTTVAGMTLADSVPPPGTWVTVLSAQRQRGVIVEHEGGLALAGIGSDARDLEGVPVVDASGRLVGLCSHTRGTTALIPVADAHTIVGERPHRAWMGIAATTALDEEGAPEVLVTDIATGGPADRAGVLVGDLITALGSEPVNTVLELATAVEGLRPGDVVTVELRREGETVQVELTLNARPFSL